MGRQSLIRQIEAIENLNNFLCHQVCEAMIAVNANITLLIQNLSLVGVPEETRNEFMNTYYAVDKRGIEKLINNCHNIDFPQIRRYLDHLLEILYAIGGDVSVSLDRPNPSQSASVGLQSRVSAVQSLALQADALCDVLNFLVKTRNDVKKIIFDYNKYRSDMAANGVPIQICKHYHQTCYEPNKNLLYQIMCHLQNVDYVYIKKIFVETVKALQSMGSGYNRSPANM